MTETPDETPDTVEEILIPHILLPNAFGDLDVCDMGMFLEALAEAGATVDSAAEASAIDQIRLPRSDENLRRAVNKVRALNDTGDADAYWGI